MAVVTKLTGKDGVVNVNTVPIAVADFAITLSRGASAQARVGKYSDRKTPGKVDLTGSLTNIDILGDHIARLIASGASVAPMTKTLLQNCDVVGEWTSSDPTNTPIVQETTLCTSCIRITSGAGSLNDTVSCTVAAKDLTGHQVLECWIRGSVTGAVIKIGIGEAAFTEQEHTITILQANTWQHEYWDISAIPDASKNSITKIGFTILTTTSMTTYIDNIYAWKGVRIGAGAVFAVFGDAVDGASNRVKITAANCFFTSGSLRFSDSDAFIDGPLEFGMEDPDANLQVTYTS